MGWKFDGAVGQGGRSARVGQTVVQGIHYGEELVNAPVVFCAVLQAGVLSISSAACMGNKNEDVLNHTGTA